MTTYRVAVGSDIALGSLTVLSPQPRSPGVQVARRVVMPDGSIVDEGLYVPLIWDAFESATEYQAMMTTFGINSSKSAAVTVYARDDQFTWTRYNGRAIRPLPTWDNYFPRNVTIIVRGLETAA